MARYRGRTWLREHAPWGVAEHIPQGVDCGDHEWHLVESGHWACYHCLTETETSPWGPDKDALLRLQAIHADLAFLIAGGLSGAELAREYLRYEPELSQLYAELEQGAPATASQMQFVLGDVEVLQPRILV